MPKYFKMNYNSHNTTSRASDPNDRNKKVLFKSWGPLADCIGKINNTQLINVKEIDVITSMGNLIIYSNNYSKPCEHVW